MRGTTAATTHDMPMPAVSRYMTRPAVMIARTATLQEAHEVMRDHRIRHLPVLDDAGNLCGVVSQRDLHLVETLADADATTSTVEEAMENYPFVVTSDTALDEVLDIMGEHKYGSVVVMGKQGVEGVFTTVDACLAFARFLRRAQE